MRIEQLDKIRVSFFSSDDLSLGLYRSRAVEVLDAACSQGLADANDAIEIFEIANLLSGAPELYDEATFHDMEIKVGSLKGKACRLLRSFLEELPFIEVYEGLYVHYRRHIWSHLCAYSMLPCVDKTDILILLDKRPNVLWDMLHSRPTVSHFDDVLAVWMRGNPVISAEVVLSIAEKTSRPRRFYFPDSLSNDEMNEIVEKYLESSNPNLNYVRLLLHWPIAQVKGYSPSNDVRVRAKKLAPKLNELILSKRTGVSFDCSVSFETLSKDEVCHIQFGEREYSLAYNLRWLLKHLDHATIVGNYLYVFQFASPRTGLLCVPAHENDESVLFELMAGKTLADYPAGLFFGHKSSAAVMMTMGYSNILWRNGVCLEQSLEWYFNEGIEKEFGVPGFHLYLPDGGTCLDRCRSIGPEIEGVVKAFTLFSEKGMIDHDYFELMQVKQFEAVPSLLSDKYAYAKGDRATRALHLLCSDQCELSFYDCGGTCSYDSFYARMLKSRTTRDAFGGLLETEIDWLLGRGLIAEEDGALRPTGRAGILRFIWSEDVFPLYRASDAEKKDVEDLVAMGILEVESTLLARPESAYMDYIFNNSRFSNALALRNKYDHASGALQDPDDEKIEWDYITLLNMLIMLTLKINEELCFHFDTGWALDFDEIE